MVEIIKRTAVLHAIAIGIAVLVAALIPIIPDEIKRPVGRYAIWLWFLFAFTLFVVFVAWGEVVRRRDRD